VNDRLERKIILTKKFYLNKKLAKKNSKLLNFGKKKKTFELPKEEKNLIIELDNFANTVALPSRQFKSVSSFSFFF
jgi:hypothetical protein